MSDDRTDIIDTTTRMAVLADHRRWDDLTALFTPAVTVDYTSLTGGEPATVAREDLVAGWAEALGRLASTQHLVADHLVERSDGNATVTSTFQATHVAHGGGDPWVLGGDYRHELVAGADGWRIRAVTMTVRWETGDRSVLGATPDDEPAPVPTPPAEVAVAFLERLSHMDVDGALALFADDAVQEMPFAPTGFPGELAGIDALRRQYGGLSDAYRSMDLPVDAVHEVADGRHVLVEYRGRIVLAGGGRYDNRYAGLFEVVDGRIRRFREYFDPLLLQQAFADPTALADTFTLDTERTDP